MATTQGIELWDFVTENTFSGSAERFAKILRTTDPNLMWTEEQLRKLADMLLFDADMVVRLYAAYAGWRTDRLMMASPRWGRHHKLHPWCQPGDESERKYMITFSDPDQRTLYFTGPDAEDEARKRYGQLCVTWNCVLWEAAEFQSSSVTPFPNAAQTGRFPANNPNGNKDNVPRDPLRHLRTRICPVCDGSGIGSLPFPGFECHECNGTGEIRE